MALLVCLAPATLKSEPPEVSDPDMMAPVGSMPGTFPESVTAANVDIAPIPGSTLGGSGSDNLRVQFPSAGPIAWTESRHNEGDIAMLIGPFDPNDPGYFPPDDFVNNYRPLADGEPFANTTLAWRVSRDNGALLATVRHNGVDNQDVLGGSPVGITQGVAYFNSGFGQGWGYRMNDGVFANGGGASADLQMGVAGLDDGNSEAAFNVATSFFPYSQGWNGAWVAPYDAALLGEATFDNGSADVDPSAVTWTEHNLSAYAHVALPDVDSSSDGMLFVAPTDSDNSTNIAAAVPLGGGWNVAVREDNEFDQQGLTLTGAGQTGFQFLYVPFDAAGLVGGHVNGADGTMIHLAGDDRFDLSRTADGEYSVSVLKADGQTPATEDDGVLILSSAGLVDGSDVLANRNFMSYEFDAASGDFIIQSHVVSNQGQSENIFGEIFALSDADFYFAFVDFENPLSLDESTGDVPGDYSGNGSVEQADLDFVLLSWGDSFDTIPAEWVNQRPIDGFVDQEELDAVLLNWGSQAPQGSAGVPEPSSWVIVFVITGMLLVLRRRML